MQRFKTILCVDGSASKGSKRPVYCVQPGQSPSITRFREGALAVLDNGNPPKIPRPILITADVPIGLPKQFSAVWEKYGGFLKWLDAQANNDKWGRFVVDSVSKQSPESPFVVPKKGDRKLNGRFPLRECELRTQGQSVYWCVGGKQVGKAALQFWFDTLVPLRKGLPNDLAVWPFEPAEKPVVVAECYPARLHQKVWGRPVIKTNPLDIVEVLYARKHGSPSLCDDKTWLHAASSDDEFDMFTTALAVAEAIENKEQLLTAPESAKSLEGWMLLLPSPR